MALEVGHDRRRALLLRFEVGAEHDFGIDRQFIGGRDPCELRDQARARLGEQALGVAAFADIERTVDEDLDKVDRLLDLPPVAVTIYGIGRNEGRQVDDAGAVSRSSARIDRPAPGSWARLCIHAPLVADGRPRRFVAARGAGALSPAGDAHVVRVSPGGRAVGGGDSRRRPRRSGHPSFPHGQPRQVRRQTRQALHLEDKDIARVG